MTNGAEAARRFYLVGVFGAVAIWVVGGVASLAGTLSFAVVVIVVTIWAVAAVAAFIIVGVVRGWFRSR
jgi:hypothetical protein